MCMKKFDAEKIFFDKLTGFLLSRFQMTAPNKLLLIVHTLWNQLLLELLLNLFSILQMCYRHIEDMHEEFLMLKKYFLTNLQCF